MLIVTLVTRAIELIERTNQVCSGNLRITPYQYLYCYTKRGPSAAVILSLTTHLRLTGNSIDSKVGGEIAVTMHNPYTHKVGHYHLHKIDYHYDKQHDNY